MDEALRMLVDREQIRETILRWSRAVDRREWDLFDQSFTDDLVSDFTALGLPQAPAAQLKAMLMASGDHFDFFQHVLSNLTFHTLDANSAQTSIMVSSWNKPKNSDMFQVNGWYHDRLRRTTAGWRICERRFEPIFNDATLPGATAAVPDQDPPG